MANLDESRKIVERLGMSDRERMNDYTSTLIATGEADRAIGNEQAACEQFSKARDLYRKIGFSPSDAGARKLAEVEKRLAPRAR